MKVTVIGGGSTYTPELINGFLAMRQTVHAAAPGARFPIDRASGRRRRVARDGAGQLEWLGRPRAIDRDD